MISRLILIGSAVYVKGYVCGTIMPYIPHLHAGSLQSCIEVMNDHRGAKKGGRGGRGGKGKGGGGRGGFFGKNAKTNRHIFKIRTDADVAADNADIAEDEAEDQQYHSERYKDGGFEVDDGNEEWDDNDGWGELDMRRHT